MAYGDLKVRNLIWNTGSGDNTLVLSTLLTNSSPSWTGTATGVSLTLSGDLTVNGTTTTINTTTLQVEDKNVEIGKVSSPSDTTADGGGWTLLGATNKTFNWVNSTDAWTSSEHIHLGDNKKLLVGTGSDLQIYHDGSNSRIYNSTGELIFRSGTYYLNNAVGNENILKAVENGAVELYYDGGKKIETTSSGVKFWGTTDHLSWIQVSNDDKLRFNDGVKAVFGNSDDLKIYHDGSQSRIIESGTGGLRIGSDTGIELNKGTSENMIVALPDAEVKLFYDNSKKLETTSAGVTVTGTLVADGLTVDTNTLHVDATNNRVGIGVTGPDVTFHVETSSATSTRISGNRGNANNLHIGNIEFENTFNTQGVIAEIRAITGSSGTQSEQGQLVFYTDNASSLTEALRLDSSQNATFAGTVSDSKGDLRKIPINFHNAGTYTLVAADAGKVISEATNGANITVPASVFAGGDAITIMNHNGGNTTITQGSGVTMYNAADGSTGNRTLASRGFCTLFYREHNVVYISGAGLS